MNTSTGFLIYLFTALIPGIYANRPISNVEFSNSFTCTTSCGHLPGTVEEPSPSRSLPGKSGPKGEKGEPCENVEDLTTLKSKLQLTEARLDRLERKYRTLEESVLSYPSSCAEYRATQASVSNANLTSIGVIKIYPLKQHGDYLPISIKCTGSDEQDSWIAFQRRMDGSVDFYRNWESYAQGFGNVSGEFWLGLSRLHRLTTTKKFKLRVIIRDWDGTERFAEYENFRIGDEISKFRLEVSGYSGSLADNLKQHSGHAFSTYDRDNDVYSKNCAVVMIGAWWYVECYHSNLNGKYNKEQIQVDQGIRWGGIPYTLPFTEMSIRPL